MEYNSKEKTFSSEILAVFFRKGLTR